MDRCAAPGACAVGSGARERAEQLPQWQVWSLCLCLCLCVSVSVSLSENGCLNDRAGATTQADDFAALAALVEEVWAGHRDAPVLVGPDTHSAAEYQDSGLQWFDTFIERSLSRGDHVKAFTFHMCDFPNALHTHARARARTHARTHRSPVSTRT